MRRSRFPLALLCLLLLAVAGCGEDGGGSSPSSADPAAATPASAVLYGEALVRPGGEVEEGVRAAIRRVALVDDPGAAIGRLLEDEATTYERDIEPWLGDRVGAFLTVSPAGDAEWALVVAVRDRDALDAAQERMRDAGQQRPAGSYRGVDYDLDTDDDVHIARLGDFLVGGSLPGLRAAIDASRGDALADSDRYRDALEPLAEDRLATVFADPPLVRQALERVELPPALRQILSSPAFDGDPATLTLTARAEEIVLEAAVDWGEEPLEEDDEASVSLGELPGDAWLALATPPLGPTLRKGLDDAGVREEAAEGLRESTGLDLDRDVLDAFGGLAAYVRGTSILDLGGGLLLRTTSEAAATRLVDRLFALVNGVSGGGARSIAGGFELPIPEVPQPLVVRSSDERVVAGYGGSSARDLLEPQQRFDEGDAGTAAIASLGDGFVPSVVVLVPPIVELLESLQGIGIDGNEIADVLPYLRGYRSLAIGTKHDGERQTVRVVAALREP